MSFRQLVQQLTGAAFSIMGDIPTTATYKPLTASSYNAAAGDNTATFGTVPNVRAIEERFELREIDGQTVKSGDKKLVIPSIDLPDVTPALEDRIHFDRKVWEIKGIMDDPTEAVYVFHVRTTNEAV